jgi:SNF2 family DNA or RNA helicase
MASEQLNFLEESEEDYFLRVTFDHPNVQITLDWRDKREHRVELLHIRSTGPNQLMWISTLGTSLGAPKISTSSRGAIRGAIARFRKLYPTGPVEFDSVSSATGQREEIDVWDSSPWSYLEDEIFEMARQIEGEARPQSSPSFATGSSDRFFKRLQKDEEAAREMEQRIRDGAIRQAEKSRERERLRKQREQQEKKARAVPEVSIQPPAPLPEVPVRIELPNLRIQETLLPVGSLARFRLLEKASLWWVSNQSDDLLSLPYCHIDRLEYQVRTALRVIGSLRGRALLSDEVGLGKTVEAGLVLKEYLVRGMVKRFLVLTVPSLVDQWEEELQQKFDIAVATTNHESFRNSPADFWRSQPGIVASLHTVKLGQHLASAQQVAWDMLIVDEAHYLRNRSSQAWAAVNALPRQFLLLLTATPVQNSLEELYNLVTLLQPGQLPSPQEFRRRFVDKARPHQPKEPEELRRVLGQVMIRNTRANAGINLPSRKAETVLFEPEPDERARWERYETELREALKGLTTSQSSLWGRLLLQAAGSSPQAWSRALDSFPRKGAATSWRELNPFASNWRKKCDLLHPLIKAENGVVIFSQFLETQAALAKELRTTGTPVFVINGQTPPPERQPITEEFRRAGGALLLTHSGTEGRNLQFCQRLVNFDLPWNPMEIEQRIGRLHRIGQQQTVRIYNFVQAGSLQEHLLQILQEKLNLFELVVGETGLILGEKFSSDEFAEEVFRRWRDAEGSVAESLQALGEELAGASADYQQVKELDQTLFSRDYESL